MVTGKSLKDLRGDRRLLIMRLNEARRDLLFNGSEISISDIAMEWDFYHLGRFSQQYSHMFGELPRETRRTPLVS